MKKLLTSSLLAILLGASGVLAQSGGELHFCLRSEPKTFNPLLAADDASETVRYLTGGVLVRVNRLTQELEPGLATSWKVTNGGKTITFELRDRAALLRWHSIFRGRCRLYHATTHGSCIAFAHGRRLPRIGRKNPNRSSAQEPRPNYFPRANRWS